MNKIIAIVGRPNVGKSSLFNRFIQQQKNVISKVPGTTRDRVYDEFIWKHNIFSLIDTGGITLENSPFQKEINMQVDLAFSEADIIIFLVDVQNGLTAEDQYVKKLLQKHKCKNVILAVNKCDNLVPDEKLTVFFQLGYGSPVAISASHGINIGVLLDKIIEKFPNPLDEVTPNNKKVTFALVGRPNVGKSSILNALIKQNRAIISNVPGTTRDCIYVDFTYENNSFVIIDTPGMRPIVKISEAAEQISILKAKISIKNSDIICFVIDGTQPILKLDKQIAQMLIAQRKLFFVIVNKSDLLTPKQIIDYKEELEQQLDFVSWIKIYFVSALSKKNLNKIFVGLKLIEESSQLTISSRDLNQLVLSLQTITPPPLVQKQRMEIKKACAICMPFFAPLFLIYIKNREIVAESYRRFLLNRIQTAFKIENIPIYLEIRQYKEEKIEKTKK